MFCSCLIIHVHLIITSRYRMLCIHSSDFLLDNSVNLSTFLSRGCCKPKNAHVVANKRGACGQRVSNRSCPPSLSSLNPCHVFSSLLNTSIYVTIRALSGIITQTIMSKTSLCYCAGSPRQLAYIHTVKCSRTHRSRARSGGVY